MLRRDFILRMIEEFAQALSRIRSLKKNQRWREASAALDAEFKQLIGDGAQIVARHSETELVTRLMRDGPTHVVRDKTRMLIALLIEAGDIAAAEGREEEGRECYLKALHLLLDVLARGEVFESPEFLPKVELLKEALLGTTLPPRTHTMLMQHHERSGEFAKAENALFAMLDAEPGNDAIVEFGVAFYTRMSAQSDAALADGGLPRGEVEEGLKELLQRPT
jgi:uncharacterized protein YuzB (UPF0349 family)